MARKIELPSIFDSATKIKSKIQLVGFIVVVVAFILKWLSDTPLLNIILLGVFGILIIIFSLVFPYLKDFPAKQRLILICILFTLFLLFSGYLIYAFIFMTPRTISISGTVKDCNTGEPLKAEVFSQGIIRVETNAQTGYFTIPYPKDEPIKGDLVIKCNNYKSCIFSINNQRFDTSLTIQLCQNQKISEPSYIIIKGIGAEILKTKIEKLRQHLSKFNIDKIQIDLTYSGQIQNANGNLCYYPGGSLIIKVNGVQCSCSMNSDLTIPRTEPFGNPRSDVEQQIINNAENIIRQNLDQIIQIVANCI